MKLPAVHALILATLVSPAACLGATPMELLDRAADADKRIDYLGTKLAQVLLGGRSVVVTMKVAHLRPDKTRTIYLTPEALAGIILIQSGDDVWRYSPRTEVWEPLRCCPAPPDIIRRDAARNYDLRLVGTDSIAGRAAYVIQALPRNPGDAAHRVWVDREHYLIIGSQVENDSGEVLRSSRYLSLRINPPGISPAVFAMRGKVRGCAGGSSKGTSPKTTRILKPTYVPSGYRLVGVTQMIVNGCYCRHLQYSNGVNTISIFQNTASGPPAPPKRVNSKVTNVFTWSRSGTQFTIMGDISRSQLQKIASSVK